MGIDAPRALRQLRAEELRQLCREQGLDHRGLKGDLISRLAGFRAEAVGDATSPKQSPSPKGGGGRASGRGRGRGRGSRSKASEVSMVSVKHSPMAFPRTGELLKRPALAGTSGVSLWAASRQQLLRCGRCQALYDLGHARYSNGPESFWCPLCRFKVMDPFNPLATTEGVLKHLQVMEPHFDFTLELPHLRQWRREGKAVEVRMLRVDSPKVEQVWPRAIHFFANGAEVFAVHPPEEGHKRRDVPEDISGGLKAGQNQIKVRMVDDDCVGFVMVLLLTCQQSQEALAQQVSACEEPLARRRVQDLLAKQARNTLLGDADGEELVCLSTDTLKLQCPITMERVQDPVRGERCQHTQCFSLEAYLRSNRQMGAFNRRWLCPLCTLILRPPDLQRDRYVAQILAATPESVDEVIIASDGTWRPKDGEPLKTAQSSAAERGPWGGELKNDGCGAQHAEELLDLDSEPPATPKPKLRDAPTPPASAAPGTRRKDDGTATQSTPATSASDSPPLRRIILRGGGSDKVAEVASRTPTKRRMIRLSVNGSAPAIPSSEEAPASGYGLAVAVSMVGGGEQQRLARLELEDDDASPGTKKAAPSRAPGRLTPVSPGRKRRKIGELPAPQANPVAPFTALVGGELIDLDE